MEEETRAKIFEHLEAIKELMEEPSQNVEKAIAIDNIQPGRKFTYQDKEKQNKVNEYFANILVENCKKIVGQADKEKQIQEIARYIAKRDCYLFDNCPKLSKHACISQNPTIMMESTKNYITIATWLVNAGYRKLPKDSVVLSREEYEKLKGRAEEVFNEMTERMKAEVKIAKKMGIVKGSKETAEKDFSTIIKALEERKERVHSFYGVSESVGVDIAIKTVKELAKQLGVEIKE